MHLHIECGFEVNCNGGIKKEIEILQPTLAFSAGLFSHICIFLPYSIWSKSYLNDKCSCRLQLESCNRHYEERSANKDSFVIMFVYYLTKFLNINF